MQKEIKVCDYPNIDDRNVLEAGVLTQKTRNKLLELFRYSIEMNKELKTSLGVVAAILDRMAECCLSIEILALKARVRDSAILMLNLLELKIDLQYIALNHNRISEWLSHNKENHKPWRVSNQLFELYPDNKERDSEMCFYRHCSMVKHGNPSGEHVSFGINFKPDRLTMLSSNKNLIPNYLFAAALTLIEGGKAAIKILSHIQPVDNEMENIFDDLEKELSLEHEQYLIRIWKKYEYEKSKELNLLDKKKAVLEEKKAACDSELARLDKNIKEFEEKYPDLKKIE